MKHQLQNAAVTILLMAAATGISLIVGGMNIIGGSQNTQLVFLLAVLLVSRCTSGYFWGIFSAVVSVPLVNYMFTYPYFHINFRLSGYLLTFATMLAVSLIVSILTSRVQRQEELRLIAEKEKLRANLLRAVSHDLRTPLTSIVGATGAILDNTLPQEKQHELLQDVNADAQWLLRMIENLLAITRISGEAVPLRLETEVVEDILAESVIKFSKHFDVKVEMQLPDEILLAEMDAVLIEQVTLNLLENAVYHGQYASRILLRAASKGNFVAVTVADNGAGIPKDQLLHLFDGSLGVSESSDRHKHMGIGLSVCKSIIKAHGGTLTACNNDMGGASFTFTLPKKENEYGSENSDC